MLEPGSHIDKYEILGPVAAGGMAVVYRARHKYLGREVALKVLSSHLSLNEKVRERFAQEAYVQGQLNHPNIMPVLDFVVEGQVLGIVMPLIEGPSLAQILAEERKGCISAADLGLLLMPVLSAVAYAHGRNLIHRDLKPANVLFDRQGEAEWPGRALVADFGLAKVLNTTQGPMLTRAGTMMGTPPYMAPEQFAAAPDIGQAADVHALGMMAWQMLSGTLPFDVGNRIEEARYYTGQTSLEDPSSPGKGVKPDLMAEIKRACAIEPSERHPTARDFETGLAGRLGLKKRKKANSAPAEGGEGSAEVSENAAGVTGYELGQGKAASMVSGAILAVVIVLVASCGVIVKNNSEIRDLEYQLQLTGRDKSSLRAKSGSQASRITDLEETADRATARARSATQELTTAKKSLEESRAVLQALHLGGPHDHQICKSAGWSATEGTATFIKLSALKLCRSSDISDYQCTRSSTSLPSGTALTATFVSSTSTAGQSLEMQAFFVNRNSGKLIRKTSKDRLKNKWTNARWRHPVGRTTSGSYTVVLMVTEVSSGKQRFISKDITLY